MSEKNKLIKQSSDSVTHVDYSNVLALRAYFDTVLNDYSEAYHNEKSEARCHFNKLLGIRSAAQVLLGIDHELSEYLERVVKSL